jgi:hypothetical protein
MERKLAGSRVRNMELQKEVSALQQGAGGAHGAAWASWGGGGGAQIAGGHGGAVTPLHGPLSAGAAGRHESQVSRSRDRGMRQEEMGWIGIFRWVAGMIQRHVKWITGGLDELRCSSF